MKVAKGNLDIKFIVVLGVMAIVALIGVMKYKSYQQQQSSIERVEREKARKEREDAAREERERQLREEDEFLRKRREARLAKEREEEQRLEAERERKRLVAEAEAERQRQLNEARKWREDFQSALGRFKTTFRFSKDVPKAEKPNGVTSERVFWCALSSYPEEKRVFEMRACPGGRMDVFSLSTDESPKQVDIKTFISRLKLESSAIVSDSGQLFLTGIVSPVGAEFDIPERGRDFMLLEAHFKDFYRTGRLLEISAPKMKFRILLRSDNGKTNIDLGLVGYEDILHRSQIEDAMRGDILKVAKKNVPSGTNIKKKKFKRTAVLYDGRHIKKEITGVTKVPRVYEFIGTTNWKSDDYRSEREFREKWQRLYDQAVREDKMEEDLEAEYRAALAKEELDRKMAMERAGDLAKDDCVVEAALGRCKLVIESVGPVTRASRPSRPSW